MPNLYSYSRVGSFFTCPAQYAHRYVTRTPSPSPEGIELFMGSRFHEAMEYLYGEIPKRVPSQQEVLDRFDAAWEKAWKEVQAKQKQRGYETPLRINKEGEDVLDYYHRAKGYVERYYEKYAPFDQDLTLAVEKRVIFNLDPAGRYRMQGYIDRTARAPDGTVWIHDYKTGSRKLSDEDARNEDQLALYQIGLLQSPEFKNAPIRLAWHFVAFDEDTVKSERTDQDLASLRKRYVAKIETIEKSKVYPTKTSALCGWCDFMRICPDGQAAVAERQKKSAKRTPEILPVKTGEVPCSAGEQAKTENPASVPAPRPSRRSRKPLKASEDQLSLL